MARPPAAPYPYHEVVTVDSAATLAESPADVDAAPRSPIEVRVAAMLLALLPGALVVYFAFEGGGFFAGSVGLVALVLTASLLVRVLVAEQPFAGSTRSHAIVVGVFAAYAAWTLASALWSNAEARALVEFDRTLMYLLLLLLFGLVPRRRWRVPLMTRGLAAGMLVVCTVALITRVLPRVWPIGAGVVDNRLSYPITYWNALGILASIAILLLLGITSDRREPLALRAVAAAGIPIAAATLFFTFSRGAIGAFVVGIVVFLVIGRSRSLLWALLAVVPTTAWALLVAYHANLLDSLQPTTPGAVVQGHHVAIVVAVAALVAGVVRLAVSPLELRLQGARPLFTVPRRVRLGGSAAAVVVFVVAAVAAGGPGWVSKEARLFTQSSTAPRNDLRAHLTTVSSDGRVDLWNVALKTFDSAPIIGTGAGTYEFAWYRYRPAGQGAVVNAHNLYLETLSTLGLIGLVLLVAALAAILVALARRVRGPNHVIHAALFSAALAWAVHAGLDWDWQMPVVTAWVFAAGGAALAGRDRSATKQAWSSRTRVTLAVALLVVAVTPALLMLSEHHLQLAADAFQRGDCSHAESEAISSINVLAVRPEPYQILGYCDLAEGQPQQAVAAMDKGVTLEPGSWEFHYGLSIADAYAGINPRPQFVMTERLNPDDPLVELMASVMRTRSPRRWLAIAQSAEAQTIDSGRLTLR